MKKIYTLLFILLVSVTANAQWLMQNVGYVYQSAYPFDIDASSATNVWTVANPGDGSGVGLQEFTMTTDGGNNWGQGWVTSDTNLRFSNISAVDEDTCYVLMYNNTLGSTGALLKTTDGGATWVEQDSTLYSTVNQSFPNVVHFFDGMRGFMMGDPEGGYYELYTTTDAGQTWNRVPQANIPAPTSGEYGIVNDYAVVDSLIWFGTNKGRVYKSVDWGNTWTVSIVGTAVNTVAVITFRDDQNGLAIKSPTSGASTLFRTSDGGSTWTQVIPAGSFFTSDIQYVPGTSVVFSCAASTAGRGSSYSWDDGSSWVLVDTAGGATVDGYTELEFWDNMNGWAGGFADAGTDGIYKWNGGAVGLIETSASNQILSVYPNPSSDLVRVIVDEKMSGIAEIQVYDMLGNLVSTQQGLMDKNIPMVVNLRSLADGVYTLKIMGGDQQFTGRVVKH